MKFNIPEIGNTIKLNQDWDFDLHYEHRNDSLIELTTGKPFAWNSGLTVGSKSKMTLPKDTVLRVDRIYIRKGAADFSSVSFIIVESSLEGLKGKARFWAKLDDVNRIEFEVNGNPSNNFNMRWDGWLSTLRKGNITYRSTNGYVHNNDTLDGLVIRNSQKEKRFLISRQETRRDLTDEEAKRCADRRGSRSFFGIGGSKTVKATKEANEMIADVKFTLIDLKSNEEIGTWGSVDTCKTRARTIIKLESKYA